jgi:hypothetical protein
MSKPIASRKPGVIQNLDYAEDRYQALSTQMWDAIADDLPDPKYISQEIGSILATTRECFDHLAKDLIEQILLPHATDTVRSEYSKGQKGKYKSNYFPFRLGQIKHQSSNIFSLSSRFYPDLYIHLKQFIEAIDNDLCLVNTSLRVRTLRDLVDIVNSKKHSNIIEYKRRENEKIFLRGQSGSCMFDKEFRNDDPNFRICLPTDAKPKRAPDYIFPFNNQDIMDFTSSSMHVTKMVMDIFYDAFFEPGEKVNKPDVPTVTYHTEEEIKALMSDMSTAPIVLKK